MRWLSKAIERARAQVLGTRSSPSRRNHSSGVLLVGVCRDLRHVDVDALRVFQFTSRVNPPTIVQQGAMLRHNFAQCFGNGNPHAPAEKVEAFLRQFCVAYSPRDISWVVHKAAARITDHGQNLFTAVESVDNNAKEGNKEATAEDTTVKAGATSNKSDSTSNVTMTVSEPLWNALAAEARMHVPLAVQGLLSQAGWLSSASDPAARVEWDDIGGLSKAKQSIFEAVVWPHRHPVAFKRMGISPPRGVLLYGPPGTGKTLMARAVATHVGARFFAVAIPQVGDFVTCSGAWR